MKRTARKINAFLKGVILLCRPGTWMGFLAAPLQFSANLLKLSRWISKNDPPFNDFFVWDRDTSRRYALYEYLLKSQNLREESLDYLEFGVSEGFSFRWWSQHNLNSVSRFYGFDTFEGLPEDWGTYNKGDMSAQVPATDDKRCEFIKGLFQDTLFDFLKNRQLNNKRKILHLDADLFTSTLFVLTTLARDLKKGDIIIFDEFNVPNHEWLAFDVFTKAFYIKLEPLGAVNNYFQVAFIVA